jgi:hypothetical protein
VQVSGPALLLPPAAVRGLLQIMVWCVGTIRLCTVACLVVGMASFTQFPLLNGSISN